LRSSSVVGTHDQSDYHIALIIQLVRDRLHFNIGPDPDIGINVATPKHEVLTSTVIRS
jgi:hypothetical protein